MKALVLREDTESAVACAQALIANGFQVACVESRQTAKAVLQLEPIDLLVFDERVGGRLTHSLALTAERRNPFVNAIIMTDRQSAEADELYDLLPCLYAQVGMDIAPDVFGQLALSSIESAEAAQARVQENRVRAIDMYERLEELLLEQEEAFLRAEAEEQEEPPKWMSLCLSPVPPPKRMTKTPRRSRHGQSGPWVPKVKSSPKSAPPKRSASPTLLNHGKGSSTLQTRCRDFAAPLHLCCQQPAKRRPVFGQPLQYLLTNALFVTRADNNLTYDLGFDDLTHIMPPPQFQDQSTDVLRHIAQVAPWPIGALGPKSH